MTISKVPFFNIQEITDMRDQGDYLSLGFVYGCIGFGAVSVVLTSIYFFFTECKTLVKVDVVSGLLGFFCWVFYVIYRPIFLTDESKKEKGLKRILERKFKRLSELKTVDQTKALGKLTPIEFEEYQLYLTRKAAYEMIKISKKSSRT